MTSASTTTNLMYLFSVLFFVIMASTAAKDSGNAHPAWGAVAASAFDVAPSKDESNKRIGKFIADAAKASIADKGSFSIALSGGSQPEVRFAERPAPNSACTPLLCSK